MNKEKIDFIEEDTVVADVFLKDINNLTEHLNKIIILHNKMLEKLEEKDKIIDEAIEYIKNKYYEKNTTPLENINLCVTSNNSLKVLGILERGKNGKRSLY